MAIELSEEVKEELTRIQKLIPEQGPKFVEPENLHLTLKFFGELDDFQINEIKEAFNKLNFEKISCSLGKIGFFPSSSNVRVIWVSLEPIEKIKELNKKVEELLEKKGFRRDDRFESHVTLARVKFIKNKEEFIREIQGLKVKPVEMVIDSFSLKKSTLTKKGPVYETIKEFKF